MAPSHYLSPMLTYDLLYSEGHANKICSGLNMFMYELHFTPIHINLKMHFNSMDEINFKTHKATTIDLKWISI